MTVSLVCFVIAAVFFALAALSVAVGSVVLIPAGLFFLTLGLAA